MLPIKLRRCQRRETQRNAGVVHVHPWSHRMRQTTGQQSDISVRPITYSVLSIFARWRGNRQSLTEEFPTGKWSYFVRKDDCEKLWVMCNNFFWRRITRSMHMPLRTQRPAWCRGKVLWMLGLTRATIQCLDWSTLQVQKKGQRSKYFVKVRAEAQNNDCHILPLPL